MYYAYYAYAITFVIFISANYSGNKVVGIWRMLYENRHITKILLQLTKKYEAKYVEHIKYI